MVSNSRREEAFHRSMGEESRVHWSGWLLQRVQEKGTVSSSETSTLQSNQEKCMFQISILTDLSLSDWFLDWTVLQLREEIAGSLFPAQDTKAQQKDNGKRRHVPTGQDMLMVVDGAVRDCSQSTSWNHLHDYLKYQAKGTYFNTFSLQNFTMGTYFWNNEVHCNLGAAWLQYTKSSPFSLWISFFMEQFHPGMECICIFQLQGHV